MQAKFFKTALLVSVSAGLLTSCDSNNQTPPAERYEYKYNGSVVVDKVNKLEWMRCSLGETWNQADSICEGKSETIKYQFIDGITPVINRGQSDINVAGLNDWRLPSIQELRSLRYCTELSEIEVDYLATQETKKLRNALRFYADLRLKKVKKADEELIDIEAERVESLAENESDIASMKMQIEEINKQLASDIKNLKPETQIEKDAAAAVVTSLQARIQKEQDEMAKILADFEMLIEKNKTDQVAERETLKSTITAVEAKFKSEVKALRKLRADLVSANAKRTTSEVIDKQEKLAAVNGVISFYEKVYDKKAGDISLIAEEVLLRTELTEFLNENTIQKDRIIDDLEREIASRTNAEIEDLFEAETVLRALKRVYNSNALDLGAKLTKAQNEYAIVEANSAEQLRIAKLDREGRLAAAAQQKIDLIDQEIAITETAIVRNNEYAAKDSKVETHLKKKIAIELEEFLDILELSSLDDLDQFLAGDDIAQMPNMAALEDKVLTDFNVFVTRVAELEGTFPGSNDVVREPCGYLSRSPIKAYEKSPVKDGLTKGVWMLDKTAFPVPVITQGDKVKLAEGNYYWSGTSLSYDELYTWGVNFKDGRSSSNPVGFSGLIRLVRDAD